MAKRIFLVDDHPLVRAGIRALIEAQSDMEVCGEADDAPSALREISDSQPDLVVADLSLRSSSGLDLVENLRLQQPSMPILVLSMYEESIYAERALRAGAMGYVMKEAPPDVLLAALRKLLRGGVFVSDEISLRLVRSMSGKRSGSSPVDDLSNREMQIFQLIGEGNTLHHVSGILNVSIKTVESHVERIKDKLGVRSGRQLIQRAVEWSVKTNQQKVSL